MQGGVSGLSAWRAWHIPAGNRAWPIHRVRAHNRGMPCRLLQHGSPAQRRNSLGLSIGFHQSLREGCPISIAQGAIARIGHSWLVDDLVILADAGGRMDNAFFSFPSMVGNRLPLETPFPENTNDPGQSDKATALPCLPSVSMTTAMERVSRFACIVPSLCR